MEALTLLADALSNGGRVEWEPETRLLLPRGVRQRLEPDRETIREVLRRAKVFREQAQEFIRQGRLLPVLALPGAPETPGGCLSCGGTLYEGQYRCPMCALAVKLALEGRP